MAMLDPNGAAFYDPLGDAPPPAPLPEHEEERAKLRGALVTTRQSLAQARRALRAVLNDPQVRLIGSRQQPAWWRLAWAALGNRDEPEDAQPDPAYHVSDGG